MTMKKLIIGKLVIMLLLGVSVIATNSTYAAEVTLDDMQYVPIKERTFVAQPISFNGELVAFSGKQLHRTNGLITALEFVDAQTQLSPIRRDALRAIMFSSAYTMQNATDKVKLQQHAQIASSVAACAYLGVDDELTFIIESGLTHLVENVQQLKENLVSGSLTQADLAPMHRDKRFLEDAVMHCSENLKMWLPR
ncbi:hypothetical protein OTK49_00475 [Vibrio coralliirubri]|uniref:hypothetical protein n=1 Tax=Vibrio coralliirubri TaxID=1516159 RepID=UPI002284FC45|nr:hypothetical protein [Vibrio coralliirubri]MCY9861016.1 hypothetical protein [Vibrio coralliirubri]